MGAKIRYVKYKNILKQLLRQEEKKYYEHLFAKKANDIRQTWKLINSILKRDTRDASPSIFMINNVLTRDKNEIVKAFNQYFTEIGPRQRKRFRYH